MPKRTLLVRFSDSGFSGIIGKCGRAIWEHTLAIDIPISIPNELDTCMPLEHTALAVNHLC